MFNDEECVLPLDSAILLAGLSNRRKSSCNLGMHVQRCFLLHCFQRQATGNSLTNRMVE
jgi:hypothetical protein